MNDVHAPRCNLARCLALIWLIACTQLWAAERRVALLIGNASYQHERVLKNPVQDAELLGGVLKNDLHFDDVRVERNLSVFAMDKAVADFARRAQGADAVVFYYSGHGTKSPDRRNFLLPVDAHTGADDAPVLDRQAVSAESIRDKLKAAGARVTLLILDACRDGPGNGKSGNKGLARMGGAAGLLVAYATEEDRTAADGTAGNSPYARALKTALKRTDLPLLAQFDLVADEVRREVPGQEPTREGNLRTDVYLVARDRRDQEPTTPPITPSYNGDTTSPIDGEELALQWPTNIGSRAYLAGFDGANNKGVDIGGARGDPIFAAADGKVVYAAGGLRGYGNLIILKHNNTYLTVYAHNQTLLVKDDQQVKKGQRIAEMGSSDADRVKLHFEVRKRGKPVDPAPYLAANSNGGYSPVAMAPRVGSETTPHAIDSVTRPVRPATLADLRRVCPIQVPPEMPREAIVSGAQGVVKAQAVIKDGAIRGVTILSGDPVFHEAVKTALMQYKCTADSAEYVATQDFIFKLE